MRITSRGANDADVVVLGGGPAGAVAARLLSARGARVTVLARTSSAARALGESLPPSCGKLLDRAGVRDAVDAAGFVRATGNTVWWGAREARVERFADRAGWQVARDALDRVLLAEAERAGARIVRGALVREVMLHADADGRSRVRAAHDGAEHLHAARWVLDCTGRAGVVARGAWRRGDGAARTMAVVGVWERDGGWGLDDETHTLVESSDAGWAWSVPVSPTRRYVTAMLDPERTRLAGGAALLARYHDALARTPALAALSRGARLVDGPWARDASPYACTRAGEHGLLLVGDAASFVDPLSSFGVKKALASAWLAAVVVRSALADESLAAPALALYDRREREMVAALGARHAELAREAAAAHGGAFWSARANPHGGDDASDRGAPLDLASLRSDRDVRAAFDAIRASETIRLDATRSLATEPRAVVRDETIVLEPHLVAPALDGVRWLAGVDLVRLAMIAPAHAEVPAMFEAYNRGARESASRAVTLPEFLGALAVLVGKGVLSLA